MSGILRRFEILLPTRFNDGQSIPDELFADTLAELEQQFGSVSSESQVIHGRWSYQGQMYRDDSVRVFVDVPDTATSREFFVGYKEQLKSRFRQLDIWMVTYSIEVI